jgi:hypothetical protein
MKPAVEANFSAVCSDWPTRAFLDSVRIELATGPIARFDADGGDGTMQSREFVLGSAAAE